MRLCDIKLFIWDVKLFIWKKIMFASKHKEGRELNKRLLIVFWILFPYEALLLRNKYLNYDPATQVFTLYGMKFTRELILYIRDHANRF
jgi:hypothetical protein